MAARRFTSVWGMHPVTDPDLRCSARGCHNPAVWALDWNNPKLHEPTRRKTWLACDTHREQLSGFLTGRAFLREVRRLHPASE